MKQAAIETRNTMDVRNAIVLYGLQLFAWTAHTSAGTASVEPVNVTTQVTSGADMSPTMKTFYETSLLENAREEMIFSQFGKRTSIHGNKAEWRKFNTFPKALTPLTEGVIPSGQTFGMTKIETSTTQHGDYTAVSDRLEMESYDDIIYGATEEMGAAEGATYDTLTRNVLVAGTSVAYCPIIGANGAETPVTQRSAITKAAILTPKMVNQAATWLKKNKAPRIDGYYIAIVHPSVGYDLRESDEWKEYHKYSNVEPIYKGEIGELHGVRFVECNESKIWKAGASGTGVYATLFLGRDAFGIVDVEGEGMEMIIKNKEQVGGPLNQFSTIGYKFVHGAKILYQERMLRVESGSNYGDVDEEN